MTDVQNSTPEPAADAKVATEEPKIEEPKTEESKTEPQVATEEPKTEEPKTEPQVATEELKTEEPKTEKPKTEESKVEPETAPAKVESTPGYEKRARNIKFDASLLPESNDPAEIRKQVEFYFSDSNLPFDKFLWSLVTKDNKPIPIRLIASFKRMRRFTNYVDIVAALRESDKLDVGGDEGDETVVRKVALDINHKPESRPTAGGAVKRIFDKALKTSMYAKGFGEETPTTQIDVEKMVEPYGPVMSVRLRRDESNVFKGSVFIEFANEELLQKFAAMENKPTWNGQELDWKTKVAYVDGKAADIAAGKIKPNPSYKRGGAKFNAFREEKLKTSEKPEKDSRGGRGRGGKRGGPGGRGGRGGRGGNRGGRDRVNEKKESPPAAPTTDKNGVPQLEGGDAIPNGTKRKAEDFGADRETKKANLEVSA